jgi:hypothetical protein
VTATQPDGGPLTGTVAFSICSPSDLSQANETSCVTGGSAVGNPVQTTDLGTNPATASADSSPFKVSQLGTWCFRAVYNPTGTAANNYIGSSDTTSGECFIVKDTTTSTSAQSWVPNDTASASSVNGAPLNGTLTVQLYTGTGCTAGNQVSGHVYQKMVTGNTTLTTVSLTTTNSDVFNSDVSWLVTFSSSDPNVSSPPSQCESSSLTVNN